MKKRTDLVTNSSSSSFICELCGRVESGFDLSLQDAEMYECVNGHIFCQDEALDVNKEELIKFIIDNECNVESIDGYEEYISEEELLDLDFEELVKMASEEESYTYGIPEMMCPICQFIEYSEYDLSKYLLKQYKVSRDEVFAEVKKTNKRRKKLYENEYITYVCKQFNLDPAQIVAGWKKQFGTYEKFNRWLNS